ncbi:hypothetical protein VDG1235_460 [Verrucomicrobiia bacterium DG1235]|nr:hypothetical protein VDG1235_460 [Verrucomicrobiae bacterium DG1235]
MLQSSKPQLNATSPYELADDQTLSNSFIQSHMRYTLN